MQMLATDKYRALHYVLKIADRKSAIDFFKNVLGMKVLRHEEFEKGCEATCNGPYDGKWSKTMVGYGPEDKNFVLELTYNYGVDSYIVTECIEYICVLRRDVTAARAVAYTTLTDGSLALSNNGYYFRVIESSADLICRVQLRSGVAESRNNQHAKFYEEILGMKSVNCGDQARACLVYPTDPMVLVLRPFLPRDDDDGSVKHGTGFGRMAFACPTSHLPRIQALVSEASYEGGFKPKILTPLVSLDTPGKATVSVVIIADLSGHEICLVGAEDYKDLCKEDPGADDLLTKSMAEDKSREWLQKKKQQETQQETQNVDDAD
ncbi:glyoxalase domain-containing protein 4 isoform X2 [Folsomia candida]|uniref:Glyoxalase domain-containing protein 4 n=2 Tax=Folsomia candida TaxID=158441 RepID=A0A226CZV9_FOLCA|nr:glyoxalase domain-containing protein 4 isoform X2 [Folsomia candida]OXA38164.1 Glyoxalase domain-containing protein 4 [Folsomia candida]